MKPILIPGFLALIAVSAAVAGWNFIFPPREIAVLSENSAARKIKSKEELVAEALERSSRVKGLYTTADVANDQGVAGTRLRNNLIRLAETTEINALVIDVKEVCGADYNEASLKKLLTELKQKNIWAIARIVLFKDHSQIETHPEWYLKRKSTIAVGNECWNKRHLRAKPSSNQLPVASNQPFWRDKRGGYWLDPAHPEVKNYILDFSKKIIDLGFDELQFDYIRFPSDGDVQNAIFPAWDRKTPMCDVMKSYWEFLSKNLKEHKPDIILSADFFGYMAVGLDTGIGQCLERLGDEFDYVSFMVYPSHYYSGFHIGGYPARNLAPVNYNFSQARANPGVIVERSITFARDFLAGLITSSGASSTLATSSNPIPRSRVRLRPWLEDFFHDQDQAAARPYGIEKMKLQIEAARASTPYGWLLWNAANVYTESALRRE